MYRKKGGLSNRAFSSLGPERYPGFTVMDTGYHFEMEKVARKPGANERLIAGQFECGI